MSVEATVVAILLAGGVALFVLFPLLNRPDDPIEAPAARHGSARQKQALETLWTEKMRILRAIRDLDFDYDLGKLTIPTYTSQRVYLIQVYAAILQRSDELENEIDRQVSRAEAAIAALRQVRPHS